MSLIRYGPRSSTMKASALKTLLIEVQEKIKQGYTRKISFGELRKRMPKNLKISPVVMMPHKSRDYRTILDLSFKLKVNVTTMKSVNEGTVHTSPQHSMRELGRVIERMISLMAASSTNSPNFLFSKLDIKDGFRRVNIDENDAYHFCYILPLENGKEIININKVTIVIPSSLQMGWTESPPFFYSATETARDVAETLINSGIEVNKHPLEHYCVPPKDLKANVSITCNDLITQL